MDQTNENDPVLLLLRRIRSQLDDVLALIEKQDEDINSGK